MKAVMWVALALAFAGCTDASSITETETPAEYCGVVVDSAIRPVVGADVSTIDGQFATTDSSGSFCFVNQGEIVVVNVAAVGYMNQTVQWVTANQLRVIMEPIPTTTPYTQTYGFDGYLECAHEAGIISGSCDALSAYINDEVEPQSQQRPAPEPFEKSSTAQYIATAGWLTMVIDVVFDEEASPGLDGLRTVLRGAGDGRALNDYDQYGRWSGSSSYTIEITPGQNYTDATATIEANATAFELEILPHSHGYHAACNPADEETCLLGAGASSGLEFEIIITIFHVEAAPANWTAQ